MKLHYSIAFLFLLSVNQLFSQQLPIDFSNNSHNFIVFSNSGFSFNTDPNDANNDVGQFYNDGSQAWQGFYIDLSQPIDLSIQQQLTLNFYQYDPNVHTIIIKLENGSNPDVEVTQSTSGVGWATDITFNFSNATLSGTNNTTNATGTYSRLTIFIDGGTTTPGTYLIDDINNGSVPVDPNVLDVIYTDLVWSDEFNTNGAIESTKWFHQTQLPAGGSWYNGELQHYTNRIENSYVDNGFLNIVAISETFTDQGQTKQYTSARLNSKYAFTYGRVDVRAKLPFGDGTWPAIWMLGKNINEDGAYWDTEGFGTTNWPLCGEIDIMEHGLGATNQVSSALHSACAGCSGNTMNYQSTILNDVANEYHVYSVNWSPDQITFMIDGVGYYTYNPAVKNINNWPFFEEQYLLLNIAMGGISGTVDPSFTQSSMVIDYVRVYQNVLSIEETFADKFKISPNPASDFITLSSNETIDSVEVYSILGQLVFRKNKNHNLIDISQLNSGIYLLKIRSGEKFVTKKIVVN